MKDSTQKEGGASSQNAQRTETPLQDAEQLLRQYADMVVRIAWQYADIRSDAEDIAQEVFLKWMTAHPVFADEAHQKAWLIRVTINLCNNWLKDSRRRAKLLPQNGAEPEGTDAAQREVLDAVRSLPPKYRSAVYLHYFEGYSVSETATLMEARENTVASWLHRARAALKLELNES